MLFFQDEGLNSMSKPEKIYLENTNLMFNLADNAPDKGNLRETFFLNQTATTQNVYASKDADFLVNEQFTFEIGGKNKQQKQIKGIENAFVVKDDIEIGSDNVIPLWLFGFLY